MLEHPISRVQIWSTFLGNIFEHYDTALFGLLTPFLAPLFFPDFSAISALILTYAIIPLGMLARPIGSFVFGYIGDCYGRKEALCFSMFGMAIISGLIAFMPMSGSVKFLAPLFMTLGRIFQNFFAAGESMGGALYLIEKAPEKHHDLISGFFGASTVAGILLASAGVSLLSYYDFVIEGWRILYVLGCLTAVFGFILRRKMSLASEYSPKKMKASLRKVWSSLWQCRRALFFVAVASGFSYSCYSIALVLTNGLVPLVSDISKAQVAHLNTALLIFDLVTMPLFGWLGQHFSRQKMMAAAALCAALSGMPLFMLLEGATLYTLIVVRVLLVIIGVWFSATLHSWCQELVPAAHRYSVLSFGYAIGAQLLGSPSAAISLWLFHQTNSVSSAALYWVFLGLISSIVMIKSKALLIKQVEI